MKTVDLYIYRTTGIRMEYQDADSLAQILADNERANRAAEEALRITQQPRFRSRLEELFPRDAG